MDFKISETNRGEKKACYTMVIVIELMLYSKAVIFRYFYDTPGKVQIDHRRWST